MMKTEGKSGDSNYRGSHFSIENEESICSLTKSVSAFIRKTTATESQARS